MNFSTIFLCKSLEGSIECSLSQFLMQWEGGEGGGTPCNGLYREAPPERGAFQTSDP